MLGSRDDIIGQYTSTFQRLKEMFAMRSDLSILKGLEDVKEEVGQLSKSLTDYKRIG